MSHQHIDLVVKQYLRTRGMHDAVRAIEAHSKDSSLTEGEGFLDQLSSSEVSLSEFVIVDGINDGNSCVYADSYESYRAWACNSLDFLKPEFIQFCFPLFVNCYISLIRRAEYSKAQSFWRTFERGVPDLIASNGDEMREFSQLVSADQLSDKDFLAQNNFLRAACRVKFRVRLTTLAFQLLTEFLNREDSLLISALINERIEIQKIPVEAALSVGRDAGYGVMQAASLPEYPSSISGPVTLDINVCVKGKTLLSIDHIPSTQEPRALSQDPFLNELVVRLVHPQVMLQAAATAANEKAERTSSSSSAKRVQLEARAESAESSSSSQNALEPSVLFATVANTYDGMICLHMSQNVTQAAAGFRDHSVRVWQLDGENSFGKKLPGGQWSMNSIFPPTKESQAASLAATHQTFSDHRRSTSTSYPLLELRGHVKPVYGVSQGKDPRLILSCSSDETVRLWDTHVTQCVGKYSMSSAVWDVSFGPLGYYFASAMQDKTACMHSTDRCGPLRLFIGHTSDVTKCAWHENGTLIATGSDDKSVRLWDIRSGNCARLLLGSQHSITSVAMSRDGRLLCAGNQAGLAHVWDLLSGQSLGVLQGHIDNVHSVAFSEDSAGIVTGSEDCTVRTWDVSQLTSLPDTVISAACGVHTLQGKRKAAKLIGELPLLFLKPTKVFHTKHTPVYHVNYTDKNMVFAGGPFSVDTAAATDGMS